MKRTKKIKPGDTRYTDAGELQIAVDSRESLGPHWLKCRQIQHPSYVAFFEMCDTFAMAGAECMTCPQCGLFSVWNFRTDKPISRDAKQLVKLLLIKTPATRTEGR